MLSKDEKVYLIVLAALALVVVLATIFVSSKDADRYIASGKKIYILQTSGFDRFEPSH